RKYYALTRDYTFFPELMHLVAKTSGIGQKIRKNRNKLGKLKFVAFSEKFLRRLSPVREEVAVLIVGEVVLPEIAAIIREEENERKTEINYTVMSEEEFAFR